MRKLSVDIKEPCNLCPHLYQIKGLELSPVSLAKREQVDETQQDTNLIISDNHLIEWNSSRLIVGN